MSVSVPSNESAQRQSNHDHDEQSDSKESQRQMLPRPAPMARSFHQLSVENAEVVKGEGEAMTLAYRMNTV